MSRLKIYNQMPQKPPLGSQVDWGNPLAKNLELAYCFNEGGGNAIIDSVSMERGVFTATNPVWQISERGNSIYFSGSADYLVNLNSRTYIYQTRPFSIAALVYLISYTAPYVYPGFCVLKSDAGAGYAIGFSNDVNYLGVVIGSSDAAWTRLKNNYSAVSAVGRWWLCVVTYNGGGATTTDNFNIYMNGVKTSLSTTAGFLATPQLNTLGNSNAGPVVQRWNGYMSCFYVYSRALTQQDVTALYINPYQMYQPSFPYWLMPQPAAGGLIIHPGMEGGLNRPSMKGGLNA